MSPAGKILGLCQSDRRSCKHNHGRYVKAGYGISFKEICRIKLSKRRRSDYRISCRWRKYAAGKSVKRRDDGGMEMTGRFRF